MTPFFSTLCVGLLLCAVPASAQGPGGSCQPQGSQHQHGTATCPNPNPPGTGTCTGSGPGSSTDAGPTLVTNYIDTLPLEPVSLAETYYLSYMREEEKLARDLYRAMARTWQLPVFTNIAASEQGHMDLVLYVMQRYQIVDPVPGEVEGQFATPVFAQLYQAGVAFGSLSPLHALLVGAIVEDLDLADLYTVLPLSDNRDIDTVWQNLARGSRNHLRAYVPQLANLGFPYTGLFLDPTAIAAILASPMEAGAVDENGVRL